MAIVHEVVWSHPPMVIMVYFLKLYFSKANGKALSFCSAFFLRSSFPSNYFLSGHGSILSVTIISSDST